MISPARQIAFDVLLRVDGGAYATELLRRAELDARDAGLAEAIVLGCLRYQSQLDFLIGHFAGRKNLKLDPEVSIALRMGIYQLRYLDRIPKHAAVGESVELVKRARKRSATGLVNAVLRKVHRDPVNWPDQATELSIPHWMWTRWSLQYGPEAAQAIARAALMEPKTPVNPETGRRQDIGGQTVVPLLEIQPGMLALDLCAAPGNKTAQMIAAGARVIACDRYPKRLAEVGAEALRVALDASIALPFSGDFKFDRILVDAPCSGTGTLARNPEIKWRLRPADLDRFQQMQIAILRNALHHLKLGGKLIYSTCSLEREENEAAVEKVMSALDSGEFKASPPHVRLPGRDEGDGFFAIVIEL